MNDFDHRMQYFRIPSGFLSVGSLSLHTTHTWYMWWCMFEVLGFIIFYVINSAQLEVPVVSSISVCQSSTVLQWDSERFLSNYIQMASWSTVPKKWREHDARAILCVTRWHLSKNLATLAQELLGLFNCIPLFSFHSHFHLLITRNFPFQFLIISKEFTCHEVLCYYF